MNNFTKIIEQFSGLKALVIGDVMIDSYYWGDVERISPEAPVPVVSVRKKDNRLGGAANVALNLMTLGATPIICSVIGNDEKGLLFKELLNNRGFSDEGVLSSNHRVTSVKTRIISNGQQMLRVDEEMTNPLHDDIENIFIELCVNALNNNDIDVVIFEDYNKGVLSPKVINTILEETLKRNIPSTVDPKKDNFFAYKNCSLFKPNLKELKEGTKSEFNKGDTDSLLAAISKAESELNNDITLITLSEEGVLVKQGSRSTSINAHMREILDVSGAGDTVISVASLALALKVDPESLAALANLAGGLVCEKIGVVPIDKEVLTKEASKL